MAVFGKTAPGMLLPLLLSSLFLLGTTGCANKAKKIKYAAKTAAVEPEIDEEAKLINLSDEELLTQGGQQLDKGNLDLANLYFSRALAKSPKSPTALTGLGHVMLRKGQPGKATKLFAAAVEQQNDYWPALLGQGVAARSLGQYAEALAFLSRALGTKPAEKEILFEIAVTYDLSGKEVMAEPLYRQINEQVPNDARSLNGLGLNLFLQQKYAEAIAPLKKALAVRPTDARIRNNLAAAYMLCGKDREGLSLFEKSVGKAGAYNNLGFFLLKRGQLEQAEKALQKALDHSPTFYAKAKKNLDHVQELRKKAGQRANAPR